MQHWINILRFFIVFCWCQHNFWVSKRVFYPFVAARMHWENHFVVRHFITGIFVLMITSIQPIQGISGIEDKKNTKFSCNNFINFYKTKDYFFWLDNYPYHRHRYQRIHYQDNIPRHLNFLWTPQYLPQSRFSAFSALKNYYC